MAFDEFVVWLVDVMTSQVERELGTFLVEVVYVRFKSEVVNIVCFCGSSSKD